MRKIFLFIVLISFAAVSCQKDADPKNVDYMITGLTEPYEVVFLDGEGNSISKTVDPNGAIASEWVQSYIMDQGTPVYLYLKFKEDITASMQFSMGIIVNGKYEYQAKNYEHILLVPDTAFEVKRSGIVPFD